MSSLVRAATIDDAPGAVKVLRESITHLCRDDHRDDPTSLGRWLANKTAPQLRAWLSDPEGFLAVACLDGAVRAVGRVHRSGEIRLCYVQPGFQGRGLGSALLQALEDQARAWGLEGLRLNSSSVARAFYEHHGYVAQGPAEHAFGAVWHFPYAKRLPPDRPLARAR